MADNRKNRSSSKPIGKYYTMPHPRSAAQRKGSEQLHLSPSASIDKQHTRSAAHRKGSEQLHLSPSATISERTCEPDEENVQKETDDEDVFTPGEDSQEKQTPQSDNLDQKMTRSNSAVEYSTLPHPRSAAQRKTRSNSAVEYSTLPIPRSAAQRKPRSNSTPSGKYSTMPYTRSAVQRKMTCEPDKGNAQKETDDEDVLSSSEQSEEKQKQEMRTHEQDSRNWQKETGAEGGQPDTAQQSLQLKPVSEVEDQESGSEQLHLSPSASIDKTASRSSEICQRKRESCITANKPEALKGNGQNVTGTDVDQPDTAPLTLQSKPVSEVEDQKSVNIVHEIAFRELSQNIGKEWETLATYLGVGEKQLEHIKMNYPNNVAEQIFRMLLKWKSSCENFGSSSFQALAVKLELVNLKRLADELRGKFK